MRFRGPILSWCLVLAVMPATAVARQTIPVTSAVQATASDARFKGFDDFVKSVMEEWKIPGLAVAAIVDGEVVLSKGFGYRDVENLLPVTPRTLMAIGSNTKSFTATLLAMLVEKGKLDWNEPVQTYLPDFRLYDPVATQQMSARDLISHQSGLPRHDALWYATDLTRKELYDRLRYLEPSATFRNVYQYQNLMFMTAGYLAGRIAGSTWEDLVARRLLGPLGMTRTTVSVTEMPHSDDFAYPYMVQKGEVKRVPFKNIDDVGPAGSINSSVEEMMNYLQFRIDLGRHNGEQLLSERNARAMETPETAIARQIRFKELGHRSYGLGVGIGSYHGRKTVQHGGGIDGFISAMSWMPQEKIGVMVLTNLGGNNPVPNIVLRNVYDRLLGVEQVDWVGRTREQQQRAEARQAEQREEFKNQRVEGTSPSHELTDYVGDYEHPAYGVVTIGMRDGGLTAKWGSDEGPLEHYHCDVFLAIFGEPSDAGESSLMKFLYDKKGVIDRLEHSMDSAVSDIVFVKKQ